MMGIPYRCGHLFLDLSQIWCCESFEADGGGKKWGLRLHCHMYPRTGEDMSHLELRFSKQKERDGEVDRIEALFEKKIEDYLKQEEKLAGKRLTKLGALAAV